MTETYLWIKPKLLGQEYVLLRDNAEQGRLMFERPLSTDARVTAGGGEWTLRRTGMMGPVITIRRGEDTVAEGRMRLGGGCDTVVDGRAFRWRSASLFSGEFVWEDDAGTAVVRFLGASRSARTIQADGALPAEVKVLLLFLGGYLLALHYNDVATMTAAITAPTSSTV
ncbi:MAG TPA: hypothetical protein VEO54_10715 [Thermoanaerobaculia bacterium]|nr:hypothetical protein [Thermoanaerobaculia bacterium]